MTLAELRELSETYSPCPFCGGKALAGQFGVTDGCIPAIVNGKTWKEGGAGC